MALQFGNTTRLHHIDFPSVATTESGAQTCDQAGLQAEMKPTVAQKDLHKTGKVNLKVRRKKDKEMKNKTRQEKSAQSRIKTEILNNGGGCDVTQDGHPNRSTLFGTLTHHAATRYLNLTVEWDVLESFSEFATFLEVQNPICPAHLIDTPEKLLNVLSCEL